MLPVQIVQNWQGADSLACDKLEPARRAGIQLVYKVHFVRAHPPMYVYHSLLDGSLTRHKLVDVDISLPFQGSNVTGSCITEELQIIYYIIFI